MELINTYDFSKAAKLKNFGGENTAKILMSVLQLNKINEIYAGHYQKPAFEFIENVLTETGINYECLPADLNKIPKKGPFIIISNHPYGGVEGLIVLHALLKIRPDLKIMGNFLLTRIEPIKEYVIPVNPFDDFSGNNKNITGLIKCIKHIESGNALLIFPSGEVSTYQNGSLGITDKKWNKSAIKLIIKANVPVVPMYFQGTNSNLFHWLGFIHPILRTAKIPSELLNKKDKTIKFRIGNPIPLTEQEPFKSHSKFGRFLRAKTYALGSETDVNPFFKLSKSSKIEEIIAPIDPNVLSNEVSCIPLKYELIQFKNYSVFCTPTIFIPHIIKEIGRLREITFREIGEGTNNSLDIDEFDLYYRHLFIWDKETKSIIGGYRLGLGKEITGLYGIKGFYTRTLFKIHKKMLPVLNESVELGRSFIIKEYQKKPLSLFLLWKGILVFLLKNNDYRYLVGPVSISDNFSAMSQQLMVEFIKNNYLHQTFNTLIKPRKPFIPKFNSNDTSILTEEYSDINYLEQIIRDIEVEGTRIPVLLKKYLLMGGKIASFNVDPSFNNSLDGFLILDLADVPKEIISSLSKELNDENINKRFVFSGSN